MYKFLNYFSYIHYMYLYIFDGLIWLFNYSEFRPVHRCSRPKKARYHLKYLWSQEHISVVLVGMTDRERDSSIMIIRHFLSAYTLSSLSQSCVCVYLYSCSRSRTPWLHSDIHTHTSKHWLALSLTMRTLLRKRGRWLHSGHTYTQTPLHCHPPISPSLSPLLTLAS